MRKVKLFCISTAVTLTILCLVGVGLAFIFLKKDEEKTKKFTIDTKAGQMEGYLKYTRKNKELYAFTGIPYAKPPVRDLRFEPPIPIEKWDDVLDATTQKPKCVQLLTLDNGSEDCLHLNVYTPSLTKTNQTVMVYIYGGFFEVGDASYSSYPPDYFIEEDVIIVTFNYRLGIFGFLSTEDEVAPGNAGLKDQILALKWVQNNIEAFGGNPKLVTLFGESAGSASVSYLMQTPLAKGLFRATIMQSGSSLCEWALARNKSQSIFSAAKLFGIKTDNSTILLSKLKKLNVSEVAIVDNLVETGYTVALNPLHGLAYSPSKEPDLEGSVITGMSYEKLKKGNFTQVPSMMGVTSNEAKIFQPMIKFLVTYLLVYLRSSSRFVPIDMKPKKKYLTDINKNITKTYFKGMIPGDEELIRLISESQFDRGVTKTAELQSHYAPVYFYYFSHGANPSDKIPGVGHAKELQYMWASNETLDNDPIKIRMVKLWTNFAKNLNPTPIKDKDLDNVIWDQFNTEDRTYLNIADKLYIQNGYVDERIPYWEEMFTKFGVPPYDTY